MKKDKIKEEDQVILKPIFGKPPTSYIPVFYAIGILILFFLICMLPGMIKNGSYLIVETSVDNSALYVDDVYIGEADVAHFIPKGKHNITIRKPYFSEMTINEAEIPGNIFFSLIHRKKVTFSSEMKIADIPDYLSWRLTQIEKWSPIKAFSETYFLPNLFTETAQDLTYTDSLEDSTILPFFIYSIGYLHSKEMITDYEQALEILPQEYREAITSSATYINYKNDSVMENDGFKLKGSYDSKIIDDIYYLEVPADRTISLGLVGYDETQRYIDSFYISTIEITEELFSRFITDEPVWSKDNKESLTKSGSVDNYYLDSIDLNSPTRRPIRNISYRAAQAFCDWYENELQNLGYTVEVSIPTEYEWETAALAYGPENSYVKQILIVNSQAHELFGLFGSLWEFTSSNYLYNHQYIDDELKNNASEVLDIPDNLITIKGGSYINDDINSYTRGIADASSCSAYNGFRIIIRER